MLKKFNKVLILLVLLLSVCISSCGKDSKDKDKDKDGDESIQTLGSVDLVNASHLFIGSSGSKMLNKEDDGEDSGGSGGSEESGNVLFKITNDGVVKEVDYKDENGDPYVEKVTPEFIYNINDSYVIIVMSLTEGYLVRKLDGAVFSLNEAGLPKYDSVSNFYPNIQTDGDGNIYYISSSYPVELIKLDISDPKNITKINAIPDTDQPSCFFVSQTGNILYASGQFTRLKKQNGGLHNLPIVENFWIGLDSKFKYIANDVDCDVVTLDIDDGDYSVVESTITTNYVSTGGSPLCGDYLFKFKHLDYVLCVNINYNELWELEKQIGEPQDIAIAVISDIKVAASSDNYYYLAGYDASNYSILLKIDPTDPDNHIVENLLPVGSYDVYKMSITSDDVVTFNALRMADGAKIVGEISASGDLTVLDESLGVEMLSLERIK